MAKSKITEMLVYLSDKETVIELGDENDIWDQAITYLASRFKLQVSTVKRQLKKYNGNRYIYYPVPQDIFIDMKAKDFIDSLDLSIEGFPWHRIIDTEESIDYCQYYAMQFYFAEFNIPDYYDIETDSWIWEQIEREIPSGYWVEFGEGASSDLFVCHEYNDKMVIESMEMNGEYTRDNLYIQQVCSE